MAMSLLQFVSALFGLGGNEQFVRDAAMSSGNLVSVYSAATPADVPARAGTAAITDHGAAIYTQGMYKIRFKSVGGFSTANAQVQLVVSDTTLFTNRAIVATINAVSAAATVVAPGAQEYTGYFSSDPFQFRYTRWENAGVVAGGTAYTFDWEVVAIP